MRFFAPAATIAVAATLFTAGAIAQTSPTAPSPTSPNTTQTAPTTPPSSTAATQQSANQWRGSQLMGLDVYNNNNEKIGDITEVILGQDGRVEVVVVGVGGFLGMGQHDVGLRWDQLTFSSEPRSTTTSTNTTNKNTNTNMNTNTTTSTRRAGLDHAMVNMTRDQLKGMPAFKYANDNR